MTTNGCRLTPAQPGFITSIQPFRGTGKACNEALKAAGAPPLPANGRVRGKAELRLIWTGRGQFFLAGDRAAPDTLAALAALSDQTDGWAVMRLQGPDAAAVMARVCPLDLRRETFRRADAARTELAHMMAVVIGLPKGFEIMVMRSFARTAVERLHDAMTSVAAQQSPS